MADTITIPSPRVFLTASPIIDSHDCPSPKPAPTPAKPKQQRKRNPTTAKAKAVTEKPGEAPKFNPAHGVEKKKQSKSRNGMKTCTAATRRDKC